MNPTTKSSGKRTHFTTTARQDHNSQSRSGPDSLLYPTAAETAVLGSILLDNQMWPQAAVLQPQDFSLDAHRRIFRRMAELAASSRPIDTITVTEELAHQREVGAIGGVAYLTSLTDGLPRRLNVAHYVKMIREAAAQRHAAAACEALQDRLRAGKVSHAVIAEELAKLQTEVFAYQGGDGRFTDLDDIPEPFTFSNQKIEWQVHRLIPVGTVTVLAAEPGVGKTYLAQVLGAAVERGGTWLGRDVKRAKVLYLDRENPVSMVLDRLKRICGPGVLKPWGLWCSDEPPMLGDPRLVAMAKKYGKELVVIFDSLCRFHNANENDPTEMAQVMGQLRELAKYGATIIVLHHKGKNGESAYRGTTEILGGCDILLGVSKKDGMLEVSSERGKNRFGANMTITVKPDYERGRFDVAASPAEVAEQDKERVAMLNTQKAMMDKPGMTKNELRKAMQGKVSHTQLDILLPKFMDREWHVKEGPNSSQLHYAGPPSVPEQCELGG